MVKNRKSVFSRAFTIIELLVVVSIIALLVGILLPAIGKARDQAQLTRSVANVKQLGTACATYAAEFADRQLTYINDNFSKYGADGVTAVNTYGGSVPPGTGYDHPPVVLGYGQGTIWAYFLGPNQSPSSPGNWVTIVPIDFSSKFGAFRMVNGRQMNTYCNGRFYDPIFYAPKDTAVIAATEALFDKADEFTDTGGTVKFSSYCFSPAAMFSPDVLSLNKTTNKYYTNPFSIQSGFRSPSMSQATYGNLKTHIIEHHWLQNRKKTCNPAFGNNGTYDGCEPYYFNHSWDSSPVALYYDGHVSSSNGCRNAMDDNKRIVVQNGHGLWSKDTPMGGSYNDYGTGGYFCGNGLDWTSTSFNILTTDGIKGRDFTAK